MEKDMTAEQCTPVRTPTEPIIVLSKNENFLHPMDTVESAIENINSYLTGGEGRLPLEELTFVDATACLLEPVLDENNAIVGLIATSDHQVEIVLSRISQILIAASEIENLLDDAASTPRLQNFFGDGAGCFWLNRIFGCR